MESEERREITFVDRLYGLAASFIASFNVSYSDDLVARAEAMEDSPEHTLAYYENNSTDPLANLSDKELVLINKWMDVADSLPDESDESEEISMGRYQLWLIRRWTERSEHLSVETDEQTGIISWISGLYDDACGKRYMRKLSRYEEELRKREAAKNNIGQ